MLQKSKQTVLTEGKGYLEILFPIPFLVFIADVERVSLCDPFGNQGDLISGACGRMLN